MHAGLHIHADNICMRAALGGALGGNTCGLHMHAGCVLMHTNAHSCMQQRICQICSTAAAVELLTGGVE